MFESLRSERIALTISLGSALLAGLRIHAFGDFDTLRLLKWPKPLAGLGRLIHLALPKVAVFTTSTVERRGALVDLDEEHIVEFSAMRI